MLSLYDVRTHKYFHPLFGEMCKKKRNQQDPSSNSPINITFVPCLESSRVLFISHWKKDSLPHIWYAHHMSIYLKHPLGYFSNAITYINREECLWIHIDTHVYLPTLHVVEGTLRINATRFALLLQIPTLHMYISFKCRHYVIPNNSCAFIYWRSRGI